MEGAFDMRVLPMKLMLLAASVETWKGDALNSAPTH